MDTKSIPSLASARKALHAHASEEKAISSQRFFKTGPGSYAAEDIFMGVSMPAIRQIAMAHISLQPPAIKALLYAPIHEERMLALIILTYQFPKADPTEQQAIYDFYLAHIDQVNNWDLVDLSAHLILGAYLHKKDPAPLHELARSPKIWHRRIAIIATLYFIRQHHYDTTFQISKTLLQDKEDLIQKAVGWMLREVGKRSHEPFRDFLDRYSPIMPRTTLRYAIERCNKVERARYMAAGKK